MALSNSNYRRGEEDSSLSPFRTVEDKQFHNDLLDVLKKDPEHSIKLSRSVFFHSPSCNCNLEATEVRYDEKVGDLVLVATFRGGEDKFTDAFYPVQKNCENLIPLSTVMNEVDDFNKLKGKGYSFKIAVTGSAAKKYVYDTALLLNKRFMEGDCQCKSSGFTVKPIKNEVGDIRFSLVNKNSEPVPGVSLNVKELASIGMDLTRRFRYLSQGSSLLHNVLNSNLSMTEDEGTTLFYDLRASSSLLDSGYSFEDCLKVTSMILLNNVFDPRNDEKEVRAALDKFNGDYVFNASAYKNIARQDTLDYIRKRKPINVSKIGKGIA